MAEILEQQNLLLHANEVQMERLSTAVAEALNGVADAIRYHADHCGVQKPP
jgi:hypothetical protein